MEKPFARSGYECDELMKLARDRGLTLAVFQQTFLAPFYQFTYDTIRSGKPGDVKQINIRYNGFSRRWDWQTLQKKCAGSTYNTGPHPIGMALGFLDFDPNARVSDQGGGPNRSRDRQPGSGRHGADPRLYAEHRVHH